MFSCFKYFRIHSKKNKESNEHKAFLSIVENYKFHYSRNEGGQVNIEKSTLTA